MKKLILLLSGVLFFWSCGDEKETTIPVSVPSFCELAHGSDSISNLSALRDSMSRKTGVYVLEEGDEGMIARAWLCGYAAQSIDVQYFIFSADNVGLIAADYLVRAADRGVKVRILVDDILVEADGQSLLTLDGHPNIEIKIYNPLVNIGKTTGQKIKSFAGNFTEANMRMHNKTFIVDRSIVITGGRNIADEYFDYDHEYNFRDRDVLLLGGAVSDVQGSFNEFWMSALSKPVAGLLDTAGIQVNKADPFGKLHAYACDSNNFWPQVRERIKGVPKAFEAILKSGKLFWVDSVLFVSDMPGKNDGKKGMEGGGASTAALIKLVSEAKSSVLIESPYLVTTDIGKKLFRDAVKRGVKVQIITNSLASTDNLEAFSGYQRDRKALLETGVEIYEFRPDAAERYKVMTGSLQKKLNYAPVFGLHAKTMVVDGQIAVIGTFNLDPRSANLNTECVTIIKDVRIAQQVQKNLQEELKPANSWHTTLNFNPDREAGLKKQTAVKLRRVVPKGIL